MEYNNKHTKPANIKDQPISRILHTSPALRYGLAFAVKRGDMNYHEYLKSPDWQMKRIQALAHYGNSCTLCGSTESLNVHHRNYDNLGYEDICKDLTVLCSDCHSKHHEPEPEPIAEFSLAEYLLMGLTASWNKA